jgi:hypothetical protein
MYISEQDGGGWCKRALYALPLERECRRPLGRKLGRLQRWSRRGVDKSLCTHQKSNPNPSPPMYDTLVTILAELHCRCKVITVVDPQEQL